MAMRSEDSRLARVLWCIGDDATMGWCRAARASWRRGTRSAPASLTADSEPASLYVPLSVCTGTYSSAWDLE